MARIALVLAVFLIGAAAAQPRYRPIPLHANTVVGPLIVTPLKILEDSRCPRKVVCFWMGRVLLRIAVKGPGINRVIDIDSLKPFPVANGALALTNVLPVPTHGKAKVPSAYRFSFEFRARPDL